MMRSGVNKLLLVVPFLVGSAAAALGLWIFIQMRTGSIWMAAQILAPLAVGLLGNALITAFLLRGRTGPIILSMVSQCAGVLLVPILFQIYLEDEAKLAAIALGMTLLPTAIIAPLALKWMAR